MFFILDLIYTTVNELVTNGLLRTELNVILGHITNIINVESLRLLYSLPNLVIHGPSCLRSNGAAVIQNVCYMPYSGLLINNGYMNASDFAIYYSGFLNNNGGIIPSDFITSIEQAISALFLLLADRRDLNIDPNNLQLDARVLEESGYQDTLINWAIPTDALNNQEKTITTHNLRAEHYSLYKIISQIKGENKKSKNYT